MQVYGKELKVYLIQSLGDGTYGNTLEVTDYLEELGSLGFEVDENLGVAEPQDVDITLYDTEDRPISTWLRSCLSTADGSAYPAFVLVTLDGSALYLGVAYDENIRWTGDLTISIGSQDWATMLDNVTLETVTRQIVGGTARDESSTVAGHSPTIYQLYTDYGQATGSGVYKYKDVIVFDASANNWIVIGDKLEVTGGDYTYTVYNFFHQFENGDIGEYYETYTLTIPSGTFTVTSCTIKDDRLYVHLSGFAWPDSILNIFSYLPGMSYRDYYEGTFPLTAKRLASTTSPQIYFAVAAPPAWSSTSTYAVNQVVTYNGSRWYATQASMGQAPSSGSTYWTATTSAVVEGSESAPVYRIYLDTTTPIIVGDELDLKTQSDRSSIATFKIADIDSVNACIYTEEGITQALNVGDKLYFSEDCQNQVVMEPIRDLLGRVNTVGVCNFARFSAPAVSSPVMSPLPFRVLTGTSVDTLYSPQDMQPGLTGLQIQGMTSTAGYTGTPEDGWAAGTWTAYAIWTNQLAAVPSMLLPDTSTTLAPYQAYRNVTLQDSWSHYCRYDSEVDHDYSGSTSSNAGALCVYDYAGMRRWVLSGTTATPATWSGSTWTTGTAVTMAVAANQAVPFVAGGIVHTSGTGLALLVLGTDGTLRVVGGASTPTALALSSTITAGYPRLVTTPWGCYLVTATGYGKVTVSSGSLAVTYTELSVDNGTLSLYPGAFAALSSTDLFALASLEYVDPGTSDVTHTVVLLQLDPAAGASPLIYRAGQTAPDTILQHAPRLSMMFRSAEGDRLFGLAGSKPFQVAYRMTETIERSDVTDMTAKGVIDAAAVAMCAFTYTDAAGVLHLVSRAAALADAAVTALTVEVLDTSRTLTWGNTVSQVGVTNSDDSSVYGYDSGGVAGKKVLSIDSPFIVSPSSCCAVAIAYREVFGVLRAYREDTWTWTGSGLPPWMSLKPLQKITINGSSTVWLVLKCLCDLQNMEAEVALLEVV